MPLTFGDIINSQHGLEVSASRVTPLACLTIGDLREFSKQYEENSKVNLIDGNFQNAVELSKFSRN